MRMIKRLAKCVREFKTPSLLAPLFIALEVLMEVIIPTLMASLIDDGVSGNGGAGDVRSLLRTSGLLVLCCLAALLFGSLSGRMASKASTGFARNLRRDMFHNVQSFSFSNIDRFSPSSIVTRLTTDISNVQMAYMMLIRIAVRGPVMIVFAMIMSFRINARVASVFFAVLPFLIAGLAYIMSHAHPIFERVFKTYDKLNRVVQENLHGIRVVKSFVREKKETEKFNDVSQSIFTDFTKAERLVVLNAPLMQICVYACMLLVSWFGASAIVNKTMSTGNLTSLMTYVMQILMNLMMFSFVFIQFIISRASAERIVEILDEKSDIVSPEQAVCKVSDGSIVFENVSFSYAADAEKLCLSDVDLTIESGETVGIIGATGSSKTSLVQLVPRLYDATCGRVLVGGVNVKEYDLNALRNEVAMVLQKNVLFSGTVRENLRWGNENATDEELRHACTIACADGFISEFPDGYDTHIEQGGTNVSGGQKQRICIARAILKKPKILIFDDSTSAVDTRTDAVIRKALREEIPDTTKIIIAQRISSVEDADKIIVLDGGRVNAVGTHKQLLESSDIYREVYDSQVKGAVVNE